MNRVQISKLLSVLGLLLGPLVFLVWQNMAYQDVTFQSYPREEQFEGYVLLFLTWTCLSGLHKLVVVLQRKRPEIIVGWVSLVFFTACLGTWIRIGISAQYDFAIHGYGSPSPMHLFQYLYAFGVTFAYAAIDVVSILLIRSDKPV